jgi:hypothetical protein
VGDWPCGTDAVFMISDHRHHDLASADLHNRARERRLAGYHPVLANLLGPLVGPDRPR